jgi:hypothetical protein
LRFRIARLLGASFGTSVEGRVGLYVTAAAPDP